jgi:glycosyltransferase involved in cell wall biosynthesis
MKCDVVMWSKNGGRTLPKVLPQIDRAVPAEVMHRKILVDDHSMDNTVKIARDFNWEVYKNPEGEISAGANEALRHVGIRTFKNFWKSKIVMRKVLIMFAEVFSK